MPTGSSWGKLHVAVLCVFRFTRSSASVPSCCKSSCLTSWTCQSDKQVGIIYFRGCACICCCHLHLSGNSICVCNNFVNGEKWSCAKFAQRGCCVLRVRQVGVLADTVTKKMTLAAIRSQLLAWDWLQFRRKSAFPVSWGISQSIAISPLENWWRPEHWKKKNSKSKMLLSAM